VLHNSFALLPVLECADAVLRGGDVLRGVLLGVGSEAGDLSGEGSMSAKQLAKRWLNLALRKFGDKRIAALEDRLRSASVKLNALEAECRCYRIRLGWEIPGRFHSNGHWVWHSSDGSQKPFPGVKWEHVVPPKTWVNDYRD